MQRNIVEIDPAKCNGCGVCLLSCEEGALAMADGKAFLAHEFACDGVGSCIAGCPQNAISGVVKECAPCNVNAVMKTISAKGSGYIAGYLRHLEKHALYRMRDEALNYLRVHDILIPDYKLNRR